jgi:hypothetical protein
VDDATEVRCESCGEVLSKDAPVWVELSSGNLRIAVLNELDELASFTGAWHVRCLAACADRTYVHARRRGVAAAPDAGNIRRMVMNRLASDTSTLEWFAIGANVVTAWQPDEGHGRTLWMILRRDCAEDRRALDACGVGDSPAEAVTVDASTLTRRSRRPSSTPARARRGDGRPRYSGIAAVL